ncbi:class I SAM-dependent methyltransferase [Ruania zhangjianzhongii]|uniref:class I SAM-dependent methyltransferase n=1 Tax=Ruania zhangjianzhongii TaxID=2603206 RepID=UPI0011C8FDC3|nr:methyltransferase domain-containing protein [Ruania zhangjianzhongii]
MTDTQNSYLFDTGSEQGGDHMDHLAHLFDVHTVSIIGPIGLQPGQRCLDVGAGGGSVVRWLAKQVGPSGEVVAVDIDTSRLGDGPGITVVGADINEGLVGAQAGPYDLIHARLTLLHLPDREAILSTLADALAPGGWLVIGDATSRPLRVLSDHCMRDVAIWERIQYLSHEVVGPAAGMDLTWGYRISDQMVAAGLAHLYGTENSQTATGGSPGLLVHAALNTQAHDALLAAGAEEWEMQRYQELCHDPTFRIWNYQLVYLRGQKPR